MQTERCISLSINLNLKKILTPNKVVVVYGPRRCGKTTLLNQFLEGVHDYAGELS